MLIPRGFRLLRLVQPQRSEQIKPPGNFETPRTVVGKPSTELALVNVLGWQMVGTCGYLSSLKYFKMLTFLKPSCLMVRGQHSFVGCLQNQIFGKDPICWHSMSIFRTDFLGQLIQVTSFSRLCAVAPQVLKKKRRFLGSFSSETHHFADFQVFGTAITLRESSLLKMMVPADLFAFPNCRSCVSIATIIWLSSP